MKSKIVNKNEFVKAYPITGNVDESVANELIVFEKTQVLPLFAIYLKNLCIVVNHTSEKFRVFKILFCFKKKKINRNQENLIL